MKKEEIDAFLDAVDKCDTGDKNAFDGVNIALDDDEFFVNPPRGAENKKERKNPHDQN